ncbi:HIG1 domain family member 2A, mitochondrial [Cimex lectularius]|uniref:HIG1 domain-containing protein n=1 Tax=Cimex lectularius TaxID=79782 RepID=A0A8I6R997_CIMLE|nr:HIG1 domain family member 2A, mitochondrial [Cimex lectularius]
MATESEFDKLEWIQPGESILANEETTFEKFQRKFKENPFVPIGALATAACLFYGVRNFYKGNTKNSQLMMRARVVAQGLTVAALVGGILLAPKRK